MDTVTPIPLEVCVWDKERDTLTLNKSIFKDEWWDVGARFHIYSSKTQKTYCFKWAQGDYKRQFHTDGKPKNMTWIFRPLDGTCPVHKVYLVEGELDGPVYVEDAATS